MSHLLKELKQEHRQLLEVLDEVKRLGIASAKGRERLLAAKALLLDHIGKKDREFYPSLKAAAEGNDDLKRTLVYFADDREVVSRKVMDVFDRYDHDLIAGEVRGDLTVLYMTLKDRISTEETTLFRKFEKYEEK
jgi:predicted metalloprotease